MIACADIVGFCYCWILQAQHEKARRRAAVLCVCCGAQDQKARRGRVICMNLSPNSSTLRNRTELIKGERGFRDIVLSPDHLSIFCVCSRVLT
jgi:hypothetical protein